MIKLLFKILIKAINVGILYDDNIISCFSQLPINYVIKISVENTDKCFYFIVKNNKFQILKSCENFNLHFQFKNIKSLRKIFICKSDIANIFCENKIRVFGELKNAILLAHIIDIVECYLFPEILTKNVMQPVYMLQTTKLKFYFKLMFGRS